MTVCHDGRPLVCPTCGHLLDTAGEPGADRLWYLACTLNPDGHLWQLHTAIEQQPDTGTPARLNYRPDGPDTSRQAAALPREGRKRETYDLLDELGEATAHDIADTVNRRWPDRATTPNNVARRLKDLEDDGLAHKAGTRHGRTIYRATRHQEAAA